MKSWARKKSIRHHKYGQYGTRIDVDTAPALASYGSSYKEYPRVEIPSNRLTSGAEQIFTHDEKIGRLHRFFAMLTE